MKRVWRNKYDTKTVLETFENARRREKMNSPEGGKPATDEIQSPPLQNGGRQNGLIEAPTRLFEVLDQPPSIPLPTYYYFSPTQTSETPAHLFSRSAVPPSLKHHSFFDSPAASTAPTSEMMAGFVSLSSVLFLRSGGTGGVVKAGSQVDRNNTCPA